MLADDILLEGALAAGGGALLLVVRRDGRVVGARWEPALLSHPQPIGAALCDVMQASVFCDAELDLLLARAWSTSARAHDPLVTATVDGCAESFRATAAPLADGAHAALALAIVSDTLAVQRRATQAQHEEMLAMLASTIAHRVRNPLAGISAVVQVLAPSMASDEDHLEALQGVRDQVMLLGVLCGDLLAFARPVAATPRDVDLRAVATRSREGRTDLAIVIDGDGRAHADDELLLRALQRLFDNARDAGASCASVKIAHGFLLVDDDGPGFSASARAHLFDPFFTTKVDGTGLGLPIARKLLVLMGGSLELAPSALGGAAFALHLPVSRASAPG